MKYDKPTILNFRLVKEHPYLRALADIRVGGFVLRGIKLQESEPGELSLSFPGRKVQGQWQLVCESEDEASRLELLSSLTQHYMEAA